MQISLYVHVGTHLEQGMLNHNVQKNPVIRILRKYISPNLTIFGINVSKLC